MCSKEQLNLFKEMKEHFIPSPRLLASYLLDLIQPLLVGLQLGHEGLVFQPLAVEVPGLVVRHVLGRQHLLVDPQGQLEKQTISSAYNHELDWSCF